MIRNFFVLIVSSVIFTLSCSESTWAKHDGHFNTEAWILVRLDTLRSHRSEFARNHQPIPADLEREYDFYGTLFRNLRRGKTNECSLYTSEFWNSPYH